MPGTTIVNPNDPAVIDAILHTIRQTETGSRYSLPGPTGGGSTASGAYAMTDSTWRSWCKNVPGACQYSRAYQAPPQVQDAVAAFQVKQILQKNGDILESVPATWYVGFYQPGGRYWTTVPVPQAGNNKSVSQYIDQAWLPNFDKFKSGISTTTTGSTGAQLQSSLVPGPGDFLPGGSLSVSDFLGQIIKPFQLLYNAFQWAADPHNWYRVMEVIAGAILVLIGTWAFIRNSSVGKTLNTKVKEGAAAMEVAA